MRNQVQRVLSLKYSMVYQILGKKPNHRSLTDLCLSGDWAAQHCAGLGNTALGVPIHYSVPTFHLSYAF